METNNSLREDALHLIECTATAWPPGDFYYRDIAELAQKTFRCAPWGAFLWALWFVVRLYESDNTTRFESRMNGFDILLHVTRDDGDELYTRVYLTGLFSCESKVRFDFSEEAKKLWTR